MAYDPPRQTVPKPPRQALEIELVDNVRSCGTCEFFWPTTSPTSELSALISGASAITLTVYAHRFAAKDPEAARAMDIALGAKPL